MSPVRLSVNLTRADDAVLREHARRAGGSRTSAVEVAVRILTYIDAAQERGAGIVVTEADGSQRHVEFVG